MKSILENRPALKEEVEKIAEVAGYLWTNGWAERNGGNITVNITDLVDDDIRQMPAITEPIAIGEKVPHLLGTYFFCKGTDIMDTFDQVDVLSYERILHKLRDKCAVF